MKEPKKSDKSVLQAFHTSSLYSSMKSTNSGPAFAQPLMPPVRMMLSALPYCCSFM